MQPSKWRCKLAVAQHGTTRAAAVALGISLGTLWRRLRRLPQ